MELKSLLGFIGRCAEIGVHYSKLRRVDNLQIVDQGEKMKKVILCAVLICSVLFSSWAIPGAKTDDTNLGLGVALGEPTGITGKFWMNDLQAVQATAAWNFAASSFFLNVDLVMHSNELLKFDQFIIPVYAGFGGFVGAYSGTDKNREGSGITLGVRIPLGILWYFSSLPLELSLEVGPGMTLVEKTAFHFSGGLGVRYYIKRK